MFSNAGSSVPLELRNGRLGQQGLLDAVRGRKTNRPQHEAQDSKRPLNPNLVDKFVGGNAHYRGTKAPSPKDNARRKSTIPAEPLQRRGRARLASS